MATLEDIKKVLEEEIRPLRSKLFSIEEKFDTLQELVVLMSAKCKRLLHNHNKKVTKQEHDLSYFENYPRKKTCAFNVARLLSTSVLIERIRTLVASWLVANLPGGEMTGNPNTMSC